MLDLGDAGAAGHRGERVEVAGGVLEHEIPVTVGLPGPNEGEVGRDRPLEDGGAAAKSSVCLAGEATSTVPSAAYFHGRPPSATWVPTPVAVKKAGIPDPPARMPPVFWILVTLISVVPGDGDLGARLSTHPDVDKLMFTGSTRTGKAIARDSADTLKRLTLELGGNDAGIVLPDVDPEAIADGLFWGAFINTGQTCAALKRLYVHTDVYDQVCAALVEVARRLPMGPGLQEQNVLGPLQNKAQYDIVAGLVEAAIASGAKVLLGATPPANAGGPNPRLLGSALRDVLRHHIRSGGRI